MVMIGRSFSHLEQIIGLWDVHRYATLWNMKSKGGLFQLWTIKGRIHDL